MDGICTNHLTDTQVGLMEGLSRVCRAAEPVMLSCPVDGDLFCLLMEGEELVGALSVFFRGNVWECYAFTRPERRRTGCFTRLLEGLEAEAAAMGEEPEFCFITDGNSPDALKTLEALGAEFWYAEHAMVWEGMEGSLSGSAANGETGEMAGCSDGAAGGQRRIARRVYLEMSADADRPSLFFFTARDSEGAATGSFSLCVQGGSASLFLVEVPEALRGQGWGAAMLRALIDMLPAMGIARLILQVSGSNAPAISLYKKTGFRITETLCYYLY